MDKNDIEVVSAPDTKDTEQSRINITASRDLNNAFFAFLNCYTVQAFLLRALLGKAVFNFHNATEVEHLHCKFDVRSSGV